MGHSGTIGRMALCASFFLLTAETSPPVSDTATSDFCMRLANDIGIVRPAAPDGRTVWSVNAWNFGQRLIFGGSVATGIGVTPVEPATMEDYRWLENMCLPEGKGAVCKDDDGAFRLPGGFILLVNYEAKTPSLHARKRSQASGSLKSLQLLEIRNLWEIFSPTRGDRQA